MHGLAGKVVKTLQPETEADPAALLVSFLVAFGNAVGSGPHMKVEAVSHPARLFAVVVGRTAKARKGTSWNHIKQVMSRADQEWSSTCVKAGLASGEGLIHFAEKHVDKRILLQEGEFSRVLTAMNRDGSTLSEIIRLAWDSGTLSVMTKDHVSVDGAHVSLLAHITVEELSSLLTGIQAANGFGNRFLFVLAKRQQLLPLGGNLDDQQLHDLGNQILQALGSARKTELMHRTAEADHYWSNLYEKLEEEDPGGIVGGLLSRSAAQLLRLSVVYALADGQKVIGVEHLDAAWALWSYCHDSVVYLFGGRIGSPDAEKILAALREMPERSGTRDGLSKALSRHMSSARITAGIGLLVDRGIVDVVSLPTAGRSRSLYVVRGS